MRFAIPALVLLASSLQAAEPTVKQYQFKIIVCEGNLEKKEMAKVFSEPTIVSTDTRPFTFRSGGQVMLPKVPGQAQSVADFGIGITGKATAIDEETVRLELQWHNAEVQISNDEELEIKTAGLRLSRAVKLGKKSLIVLNKDAEKQTWAEIIITEASVR